jgi:hypothetical protein
MTLKSSSFAASVALSAVLVFGGCKSSTPPTQPAQVPNSDGSTSQAAAAPAPNPSAPADSAAPASPGTAPAPDAAAASAPAVQGPAPSSAAAEGEPSPPPQRLTARVGTPVTVTITERLSASHNEVGDKFTGVLAEPVRASDGGTIFSRGTRVTGTVVASKGRGRFKGAGALGIELTSIAGTPVSVSEYEKEQAGKGKRSAGFIGGGAGGGALIGGLAGGGKGALIGGLLGAGAGTAGAAFTGNKDVVIPSESRVTFRLRAPLAVTVQPR